MENNENWTYFLRSMPPLGEKMSQVCDYCHRPHLEHRQDNRCPIPGCTLAGPPDAGAGPGAAWHIVQAILSLAQDGRGSGDPVVQALCRAEHLLVHPEASEAKPARRAEQSQVLRKTEPLEHIPDAGKMVSDAREAIITAFDAWDVSDVDSVEHTFAALKAAIDMLRTPVDHVADTSKMALARALVDEQAEDDGLWFQAEYITEAYLQQALQRLHAAVETATQGGWG